MKLTGRKGTMEADGADAWSDHTVVHLREPMRGASLVLWIDVYDGPEITPSNYYEDEIELAVTLAKLSAGRIAKRWRGLTYEQARAEFDAM